MKETVDCPSILFLIFNRPDLTQQAFRCIRQAGPKQLFIAADGPRPDQPADVELCASARQIVAQVDWECEVHTLFRETNLGCGIGVSSAITWFFEHVEEGIILEDDCVPHPSFFRFCAELLDYYCDDERIMVISGNNFQQGIRHTQYSYYFSRIPHIWGWATWRRAWQHYDHRMRYWPELREAGWLFDHHESELAATYWRDIFDKVYADGIDTWDYRWLYSCWAQSGLAVLPEVNLVSNIGFDERATHTKNPSQKMTNLPVEALQFPLHHPPFVVRNKAADQFALQTIILPPPAPSLYRRVVRKIFNGVRDLLVKTGIGE